MSTQAVTLTPEERHARLSEAGRKGGKARAQAFTSEYQRAARAKVKRESLQRAGRKGYEGCVRTHGKKYAGRIAAQWRREHPSDLEQIVMDMLDELGLPYEKDYELGNGQYVDLMVSDLRLAIEVNGEQWHSAGSFTGEGRQRLQSDKRKARYLRSHGFKLLWLPESDIRSGVALDKLTAAISEARRELEGE